MTDNTAQEVDRITGELGRLNGNLSRFVSGMNEKKTAEQTLSRDLRRKSESAAEAIGALTGSAKSASHYFSRVLAGSAIGATFAKLVSVGSEMTNTYRELVNVGQNFEGSILEMSIAAGAAGMPLDDFADSVKKSSKVVSRLGMKDFTQLTRSVHTAMVQHGMYAMTTGQVTEHLGGYLETQRRMGMLERTNGEQRSKSFVKLMGETTALASASGVAREEIQNLAQGAIQSSMAMSRMAMMSQGTAQSMNNNLQESMAVLAAHGRQAADFLTGLHAEAFGQASAAFTEQGKSLISVGLGHLGTMFEKDMNAEQTIEAQQQFRSELTRNIPLLRDLAKGSGESAAAARRLLEVQSDMQPLTVAEFRRKKKEAETQDGITKLFTSLGRAWELIVGSFKEGFLKGFRPLFRSVGDFTQSGAFKNIQEGAVALGDRLGNLIAWVLNPTTLDKIGTGLKGMADFVFGLDWKTIASAVAVAAVGFAALKGIQWAGIIAGMSLFGGALTLLTPLLSHLNPKVIGGIGLGVAGLSLAFKALKGMSAIKSLFGDRDMTINAGSVTVNGGDGGSGGGGNGGRSGRRGGMRRVGTAFRRGGMKGGIRALGRMGKDAAKSMKGLGALKGFGKILGKAGPMLGIGMEALDYLTGSKAVSWKNLAKSGISLGGGALGGLLGSVAGPLGSIGGGVGGYAAGGKLADLLLGADDKPGSNKARMAMTAAGVGATGLAASQLAGADADKEAPTTQNNDPLIKKLDELIMATTEVRDVMMRTQQGIAAIQNTQNSYLSRIEKNGRAN